MRKEIMIAAFAGLAAGCAGLDQIVSQIPDAVNAYRDENKKYNQANNAYIEENQTNLLPFKILSYQPPTNTFNTNLIYQIKMPEIKD